MSKHKARRKKKVQQPELIEPEMPRNVNGRVALSMSLLHLAASVITKRNPEVLSVLDEDLKRFYPEKHAYWTQELAREHEVPMRADLLSVVLAHVLAENSRSPVLVMDPDSAGAPIGWQIAARDKFGLGVKPVPDCKREEAGEFVVSMRALLSRSEEPLAQPDFMPLTLSYTVDPKPALRLEWHGGISRDVVLSGGFGVKLVHHREDGPVGRKLKGRASDAAGAVVFEVASKDMLYLMASDEAVLYFEKNGLLLSAPVPEPDGSPVGVRVHALRAKDDGCRLYLSRRVLEAFQAECPWLGEKRPADFDAGAAA